MKPSEVFRKAAEYLEQPVAYPPFACIAIRAITGTGFSLEKELFYDLYYYDSDGYKNEYKKFHPNVPWWLDYDIGPRILALLFAAEFYEDPDQVDYLTERKCKEL